MRLVEKGGGIGGTWYWNQYPGAQCDIESYIYLPLLEELGVVPTERYAGAPEILAHAQRIADHYGLSERALLGTGVTDLRWDDGTGRWTVSTDRGDRLRARFVVTATGPLHRPKLPGVDGIGSFRGHSFHTSRWDYGYTGGGPEGGLDRLANRRVAVIGTGATAVQIVPHVGRAAAELLVFQRTPSSIDVRANRPTDPAWAATLGPGWQRERIRNFNAVLSGVPQEVDLVDDGWTTLVGKMMEIFRSGRAGALDRPFEEVLELANFEKMEEIRRRVDAEVDDPAVREALKPYYKMFCKRPCFHDEYLATFNRPNVTLVDTDGRGVDRITEEGVVAGGVLYPVDCIIYATGFEVGTGYERRAGFRVHGRDGRTLTEKWDERGMRTLHGMLTHDYPQPLHPGPVPRGVDGQLHPAPRRGHPAHGRHRGAPRSPGPLVGRSHRRCGGRLGGRDRRPCRQRDGGHRRVRLHAGLLQQRGTPPRRSAMGRVVRQGLHRVLPTSPRPGARREPGTA